MTEEKKFEKKIGTYICTGCGIGESLDIDALSKVVTSESKIPVCKTHPFLCEEQGVNLIKSDIAGEGVNTIVVAACSSRVNYDIFDFGENILMDRVDLREKVTWCQEPNNEDTQMMAEDYTRMGIAKMKMTNFPVPVVEKLENTILVIGGGVTGLTAARNASAAGNKVDLIEKTDKLGGFMNKMKKTFPRKSPYTQIQENDIAEHIEAVENDPDITVHLNTTIESISGAPGMFDVVLLNGSKSTIKIGAVVLATGWRPYDVDKLTHLGAGLPNVVSNVDFEEMAAAGSIKRPSDGKTVKSVVFIQCAGSRDENHLPYCSSVCCAVSLKHALYLREQDSGASATIIYKDIRTPGNTELFYKQAQQDPGIFLTKGEVTNVAESGDSLLVTADNTLIGESVAIKADMIVLATGMVPSTYDPTATVDKPACELTDRDRLKIGKASILNLTYRKGAELPDLNYGFPDSHYICFPYETQRTGIYTAGAVRHPQDIATSMNDAAGAALKAIQCVTLGSQGKAVHPRAGDMSYPEFNLDTCTQCKRCTEECPFGTLDEDDKGTPLPNPTRCRRCGICMGACPQRIINFADYSIPMIASMIKAVDVPDEDTGKLRILAFICENDAMPAIDMAGINRLKYNASVRFIQLRCLGGTNLVWIGDALSSGFDGILLIGCKHGDDYQCHFIKGSELAETRMSKVQETLDRLMLESERIRVEEFAINEYNRVPEVINDFMETLEGLDPNPYKGF
ncbi:Anaerobic respiratory complex protein QmoB [hydrothermal vent metagenome]|uniref:Anaerobic respiratory complex protein QmoB n=1 Tax=hydrothermal vent metagenome TaxID=652676 RepID=A0A3B1BBU1_9ZZZZ